MTIMQTAELLAKIAPKTTLIANFETGSEPVSYAYFEVINDAIVVSVERFDELVKLPVSAIAIPPTLIAKLNEAPKPAKVEMTEARKQKIQEALAKKAEREKVRAESSTKVAEKRTAHKALVEQRKAERKQAVMARQAEREEARIAKRQARAEMLSEQKLNTSRVAKIRQAYRALLRAEETGSEKILAKALEMVDKLKAA